MSQNACQAGQAQAGRAYNPRLLGDARAGRFTVFTATSPDELAEEHPSVGQGLFTWAFVRGLKGGALDARERTIRADGLGHFVANEVFHKTQGRQRPEAYAPGSMVLVRR